MSTAESQNLFISRSENEKQLHSRVAMNISLASGKEDKKVYLMQKKLF